MTNELPKVRKKDPKIAKIGIPPIQLKNRKNQLKSEDEARFLDLLDTKNRKQVLGWLVERGAIWGGGWQGGQNSQNRVLIGVVAKNKRN